MQLSMLSAKVWSFHDFKKKKNEVIIIIANLKDLLLPLFYRFDLFFLFSKGDIT